jgi:hypothetical protein
MAERTVGNTQIAGDLGLRLTARLHEMNCFQLEFFRIGSYGSLHDLFPFWKALSSSLPSLFPGSRPRVTLLKSGMNLASLPKREAKNKLV